MVMRILKALDRWAAARNAARVRVRMHPPTGWGPTGSRPPRAPTPTGRCGVADSKAAYLTPDDDGPALLEPHGELDRAVGDLIAQVERYKLKLNSAHTMLATRGQRIERLEADLHAARGLLHDLDQTGPTDLSVLSDELGLDEFEHSMRECRTVMERGCGAWTEVRDDR